MTTTLPPGYRAGALFMQQAASTIATIPYTLSITLCESV